LKTIISIDLNYSHGILETLLFMYIQKYFPKYLNKRDSLMLFEFSAIFEFLFNNAPNDYTKLAVNLTPLLKSFFYHFQVEENGLTLGEPPSLFKINDKIYTFTVPNNYGTIPFLSICRSGRHQYHRIFSAADLARDVWTYRPPPTVGLHAEAHL